MISKKVYEIMKIIERELENIKQYKINAYKKLNFCTKTRYAQKMQ